ncbi:MAG TPA: phosphatase PAP2 family protein [Candidatus Limnocylindrales bacterium]|nr:phosphatase PAP2 family protein [Candidatus Limnocylindrales bacterium]
MRSPLLDAIGSIIGLFGQAEVTVGVASGLAVARARRDGWQSGVVPLLIVVTILIEAILKTLIPHAPPPHDRSRTVELLPFVHVPFSGSFPSGHVARITFLAGIVRGTPSWLRAVAVLLMVTSRLYLGEHWLSDCIGGLALGYLVSAGALFAERVLKRSPHTGERPRTYSLAAQDTTRHGK